MRRRGLKSQDELTLESTDEIMAKNLQVHRIPSSATVVFMYAVVNPDSWFNHTHSTRYILLPPC